MIITTIILNYKKYEDTCLCISSLEKQILSKNYSLKILVIDNNSGDDSTLRIQEKYPKHSYVFNKENYGFAKGVNQGISLHYEESDFFFLVNNDAILEQNCLNNLLEISKGENLAGPVIFYKDKPGIVWQSGGYFSRLRMNILASNKNKKLKSLEAKNVDFLSGCVLLIPKKVIDKVGKLDEEFFFYGEDLDFCLRAKKAGIKILYYPKAQAWHNIQDITISRTNPFVLKNLAFSYNLIIIKHYTKFKIYGLLLFIFIYTPFRLYQIIKGRNSLKNISAWIKGGITGWNIKP
jgi:GT2 family glycosyltransferase